MKDFLHGRPSVASNRSSNTSISLPSNLPPISNGTGIEEPARKELPLSAEAGEELVSTSKTCSEEPQIELVPDAEGRIGHIVVTCRCGEKITLQCNY
jgi:hypothetical protein